MLVARYLMQWRWLDYVAVQYEYWNSVGIFLFLDCLSQLGVHARRVVYT